MKKYVKIPIHMEKKGSFYLRDSFCFYISLVPFKDPLIGMYLLQSIVNLHPRRCNIQILRGNPELSYSDNLMAIALALLQFFGLRMVSVLFSNAFFKTNIWLHTHTLTLTHTNTHTQACTRTIPDHISFQKTCQSKILRKELKSTLDVGPADIIL